MSISPSYPYTLTNGSTADATQVMADFLQIQNDVNTNAASNGINNNITQITGLTTPLSIAQGGTGQTTQAGIVGLLAGQTLTGNFTITGNLGVSGNLNGGVVQQSGNTLIPPGTIFEFPFSTAPAGYIAYDGSLVSRTGANAALWAAAQASGNIVADGSWDYGNFSTGNGTTTFRVPDFRGYFKRGFDNGRGVDPGRTIGSSQADQFQTHTHGVSDPTHTHTTSVLYATNQPGSQAASGSSSTFSNSINASATGVTVTAPNTGRTGSETRPLNIAVLVCGKL